MPSYLIERTIPGASELTQSQLSDIAGKSNGVLQELGPDITWEHSYVAGDKIYCVYQARDAEIIREHARRGGFPADLVTPICTVIDPTTAKG